MLFFTKRRNGTVPPPTAAEGAADSAPYNTTDAFVSLCKIWVPKLKGMAAQLHTISKETEDEFLALGSNLQVFSSGCSKSSSDAAAIVTMIEGENGLNIHALKSLFGQAHDEVETCASFVANGLNGMADLLPRIDDIIELKLFLERLARSVGILGTLMKTETARITEDDFTTMTAVVDELGLDIERNTDEIDTTARSVKSLLVSSRNEMHTKTSRFNEALQTNKMSIHNIFEEINAMTTQAAQSCRRIEDRATQVSPEIGKVVAALQYHDICRQQMEHVGEVLEDVASKIASSGEEGKAALPQWIINALTIQISQLEHVTSETSNSAATIAAHLSTVADLAKDQAREIETVLDESGTGGDRITKIQSALEFLSATLSESKIMITDVSGTVSDANSSISALSRQVENIKEISENINILAMNTILKSSRTGETGKGLGVLANEIRKLSIAAQTKIMKGTETITAILKSSADLEKALSDDFSKKLLSTDEIILQTERSLKELTEIHDKIKRAVDRIICDIKSLEADITRIVSGITFGTTVKTRLDTIIDDLRAMLDEAVKSVPDGAEAFSHASHNLHELAHRYTMQSERKVHEEVLNAIRKSDGSVPAEQNKTGSSGLGNNVELF